MTDIQCKQCGTDYYGRANKLFCSVKCKSQWHRDWSQLYKVQFRKTNRILQFNYKLLSQLLVNQSQIKMDTSLLLHLGFYPGFCTNVLNIEGKEIIFLYDIGFYYSTSSRITIVRKTNELVGIED